jgi:chromosome segregation ATPase
MNDRTFTATKQRNEAMSTLGRLFEMYAAFPKTDAELESLRRQYQATIVRLERDKNESISRVRATSEEIQSHKRAIASNLQSHGAQLSEPTVAQAIVHASIDDLRAVHGKIENGRRTIDALLREIDEIVRFYGTVKTIGYVLLGIIFLLAVLVLTGNIPLYTIIGA